MHQLRRGLHRCALWLAVPGLLLTFAGSAHAQGSPTTCALLDGAGGIVFRDHEVVYSAAATATGSTIAGLVIVRASPSVRRQQLPPKLRERVSANRFRHQGGGGRVGPVIIVIDGENRTVWINDSLQYPFTGSNNVLLIDVADDGAVTSAGQATINRHFPQASGACRQRTSSSFRETRDTLLSRFQATPAIRRFVGP